MTDLEKALMHHLQHLCVEIGPRPSGSPQNHAAADYIAQVFQSAGLEVEEQRYDCPAWEHQQTQLLLNEEPLDAAANPYSPPCDVTAPAVAAGTVAELEAAELSGRIGLLYGELTQAPLSPKSWFLITEREKHIIRLLEQKKPAALITVQAKPGYLDRLIEDWEFTIPSVTVPVQTGLTLLRQRKPVVHLKIDSHQQPGYSGNVVARKAGQSQAKIVLCAHYDTKIDTPGAWDNGSGVAVLLTLAKLLSQKELAHSLEWIAFSAEEYLPIGDDEYLRRCEDELPQIVTAINIDGVGQYVGADGITMFSHAQDFQKRVEGLAKNYPGVVWVDPWPQSNHSTFAMRGVPSIALGGFGWQNGTSLAHLRTDTIEWLNPAKLNAVALLIADIVEMLQDKSRAWARASGQA